MSTTAKELKYKTLNGSTVVENPVIVEYAKKDAKGNTIDTTYAKTTDIKNGKLSIKGNGTVATEFTANQSSDVALNIKGTGATTVTRSAANEITINSTDTNTTYSAGTGLTLTGTTFSANIENTVTSTATNKSLSANMGKNLQDQITNLKAVGRFLAIWNCTTGLPTTYPVPDTYPYTYSFKTGDYYILGVVSNNLVWNFNSTITYGSSYDSLRDGDAKAASFTSNGTTYTSITFKKAGVNASYNEIYYGSTKVYTSQNSAGWTNANYRIISFTTKPDTSTNIIPIVSEIATEYNKVPSGTSITKASSSASWVVGSTVYSGSTALKANDYYVFDGATWSLISSSKQIVTWDEIAGKPGLVHTEGDEEINGKKTFNDYTTFEHYITAESGIGDDNCGIKFGGDVEINGSGGGITLQTSIASIYLNPGKNTETPSDFKVYYKRGDANVTANDEIATIGDISTAGGNYQAKVPQLGSTIKPLYTSAAGTFAECSTYAGGTKVTLNNSDKGASTASFYAPTAGGTSGYYLKGAGTTSAPTWQAPADSSTASAISSTGTSLVTERDVYFGLPTINGAHNYTSSTNIYAPTSQLAAADTKAYLVGATASDSISTVKSNTKVYMTSGKLYSNNSEVVNLADDQTMSGVKSFSNGLWLGIKSHLTETGWTYDGGRSSIGINDSGITLAVYSGGIDLDSEGSVDITAATGTINLTSMYDTVIHTNTDDSETPKKAYYYNTEDLPTTLEASHEIAIKGDLPGVYSGDSAGLVPAKTSATADPAKVLAETGAWVSLPGAPAGGSSVTTVTSGNASAGSASSFSRSDHQHNITLATGDANGQVKIAETNVSVKGLAAAAYKAVDAETMTSSSTNLPTSKAVAAYVSSNGGKIDKIQLNGTDLTITNKVVNVNGVVTTSGNQDITGQKTFKDKIIINTAIGGDVGEIYGSENIFYINPTMQAIQIGDSSGYKSVWINSGGSESGHYGDIALTAVAGSSESTSNIELRINGGSGKAYYRTDSTTFTASDEIAVKGDITAAACGFAISDYTIA